MWEHYLWFQKQNSHVSQAQCCTDEVTLFPDAVKAEELLHYIALYGKEMLFALKPVSRELILSLKRYVSNLSLLTGS